MVRKLKPGEHPHLNWGVDVMSIPTILVPDLRAVVAGGVMDTSSGSHPIREAWEGDPRVPSRLALLDTGRGRFTRVRAVEARAL